MRSRTKMLLAAVSAAALLSMAVAVANAARLEIPNWERGIRVVWSNLVFNGAGHVLTCHVTLEGTFHNHTYAKVERSLIGYITLASVAACTGGTATVLTETLPWHIQYESFATTLPDIEAINLRLIGVAFRIKPTNEPNECLVGTTNAHPARGIGIVTGEHLTSQEINSLRADERTTIPLGGAFACLFVGNGSFSGVGNVTVAGETARVRIRLI
jgi:hypothetical protein